MKNKHRKKVASVLKKKQRRLGSLINLTLLKNYQEVLHHDRLQYYQGYHDVASIFLSALGGGGGGPSQNTKETTESLEAIAGSLGLDLPAQVLGQLSKSHFRDALQSNFTQLQTALRLVLMPLIWYFDVDVHDHLADCGMEPVFAVSWIITWFSHDVRDTDLVKRLFDAFLVSHPLLPVYMTVAMVCHPYNRLEILSTECDFSLLHQTLAGLPKNSSMVGWKYQVGDGYVSGDEVDDATATTDIGTATTDMDVSLLSEDLMDRELEFREEEFQSMQSPIAGPLTVGSKAPKAPFQELIDTALSFMRRMPPKSLTDLSTRYYSDDFLGPMMALAPSIVLLQSPPVWSIQNSCTADWVLKERRTGKQLSRRDRRRYGVRSPSPSSRSRKAKSLRSTETTNQLKHQTQQTSSSSIEELSPEVYVEKMSGTLPVIACGLGAGDDEIARKKRKRRKRMIVAGAVFAALTISCISVAVINGRSVTPAIMPTPKNTQHKIVTASDKVPKRERPQQTQKNAKRATPSVGKSQTKSQRTAATTQHRGITEKRTVETKIPSMPKRSPPPKEVKKAPLISRPNPPLKQTSSPAVRGQPSPERPPLPARAQNMVAPRTTVAVPSEKSETKMGVHQVKYATRSAKMKEVTRTVGTFITEAREVNTWTLEETVQILTNDFFVPGYQKVVVPAMHKLKGDVWTTAKESVLLPAHRKMTNEILPAVRNEVQSVIIPGTMHLFENNVYYPLRSQLSNARDALFIGARIARFALVEGRRELRNFVREAGEALKEDDFVL